MGTEISGPSSYKYTDVNDVMLSNRCSPFPIHWDIRSTLKYFLFGHHRLTRRMTATGPAKLQINRLSTESQQLKCPGNKCKQISPLRSRSWLYTAKEKLFICLILSGVLQEIIPCTHAYVYTCQLSWIKSPPFTMYELGGT